MSHIHIPDGVLPTWLWLSGWLAAAALLAIASRRAARGETRRAVPLVGVTSALVLIAMSTEIVPIAYHINLTVIAGVMLGPWLGAISAFVVVLILALLGHGGITVVGLNTLIISTEMALGWALVRAGARLFGLEHIRPVAALSTVVTLAVTTTMLVGIVALAGPVAAGRETGALDPETLEFKNPLSGRLLTIDVLGGEHEHHRGTDEHTSGEHGHDDETSLSVSRFAAVVYTLGPIGWTIEALVTAAILGYVSRVRPSLLFAGAGVMPGKTRIGDEHGRH